MELVEEIKSVIATSLKVPVELLEDSSKLGDLGVSSFDVLQMGFDLEEKFNIDIPMNPGQDGPALTGGNQSDRLGDNMMSMSIADLANAIKKIIDAKAA